MRFPITCHWPRRSACLPPRRSHRSRTTRRNDRLSRGQRDAPFAAYRLNSSAMNAAHISPTPRRIAQPLLGIVCLIAVLLCTGSFAQDRGLPQQRDAFRTAYAAAEEGRDWRPLARGLESYPLYPYLEAAGLQHDLAHAD